MNKKVSVVIPTYKRNIKYLSRAVNSVINQTYKNIEVIVIDDSPCEYKDRSSIANYMKSIASNKIIYYQNKNNIGASLSRNKGLELASGDYITFLDDDDEYLPEKIEKQITFMVSTDCDMSFSNMIMYNDANKIVEIRKYKDINSLKKNELLKYHILYHLTGTPTFMYKSEKLREIGGFKNVVIGEEFYLMLQSIIFDLKIGYLDSYDVAIHKHNDGSVSQSLNKEFGENNIYKFKKQNYFSILSIREKMYVRFRHYAVLSFFGIRSNNFTKAFSNAALAFFVSPVDFILECFAYSYKIPRTKKYYSIGVAQNYEHRSTGGNNETA